MLYLCLFDVFEMGDRGERGYARVPYLILESVEPLEDELKEGVQVVWAR